MKKLKSFCHIFLKNDVLGPGIMNHPCFGVCFEIVLWNLSNFIIKIPDNFLTRRFARLQKFRFVEWRWKKSRITVKNEEFQAQQSLDLQFLQETYQHLISNCKFLLRILRCAAWYFLKYECYQMRVFLDIYSVIPIVST